MPFHHLANHSSGAGILLVATRDRLARDTLIAALVEQRVQELGASIRAVDGSGNTDTPEGLLVRWRPTRSANNDLAL